ncbi:hypothetical protein CHLRE_01g007050v5 [Chlamydomonas reinhardtii]|uniref:Uncharacterized protein n=1 Tax=Chlamydomonas reinhardtii TaxID=3055 RepID=A8JCY0_CHLRE|nr:uncharacterized protein CHLRE_01g007050v5 [Chlamydomonas reinhardtii]PNW87920.1 hypothetical protein CHLRE_01g007050v5 [Chlamydomonas reinhardtii]|eukprot:XP_001700314.1 predicted protein [Chlamydomonas reinhardtii]
MQRACARPQSARTGTVLQRSPSLCPGRLVATSSRRTKHAHVKPCQAVADQPFADDESSNTDYAAVAASLNSLLAKTAPSNAISGRDLRDLVRQKWGRSYDVRLAKLQGRMYLQVMWKFLEQASFPLTEQEYMQQLDAVAEYLNDWGAAETVRQGIQAARRPPGYTGGGNARCISIPLAVDLGGTRSAEWI